MDSIYSNGCKTFLNDNRLEGFKKVHWGPCAATKSCDNSEYKHVNKSVGEPMSGVYGVYPESGFIVDLNSSEPETLARLRLLKKNEWLDRSTRMV